MSGHSRVLFVNHTSTVSGAEKVLIDIVAGRPTSSVFLFENGSLNEQIANAETRVASSRTGGRLSALTRSANPVSALPLAGRLAVIVAEIIAASRRHDVIYANSQKAFILGALAAAITRKPLIWHLHDIITPQHFGESQRRLQVTLANRYCRAVIGPSQAVADAFVAAGGNAALCRVVPNGVKVVPDSRSRSELRRALALPEGRLIGVFSRLAPWKGQHIVLRALSKLQGVHCIFVGAGLFGERTYEISLHTLTQQLGLSDRVRFLGHRNDVGPLMQAVDAVVHPSVGAEPFALTLLEAMQLRAPVIATANGGSTMALDDGRAGSLVPTADATALARAVRDVVDHPARSSQRTDHAEARAKSWFSVPRMQQEINAVIESVARGAVA